MTFTILLHILIPTGPPAPLHTKVCDVAHGGTFFYGEIMEIKPAATFDQQVDSFTSKGIIVSDKSSCRDFLHCVNYYRFSAYLLPFRNEDKTYKVGTEFDRACKIYEFDAKMRSLLFKIIEEIEMYLRTQLAYNHSHEYGPLGYKDVKNFSEYHKHEVFKKLLKNIIDNNKRSLVVQHHLQNYDGKFPLWVIIEFFSMGMLSYFYTDLKLADKKAISKSLYDTVPSCLDSWLRCITDLRNRCAHYSRLYYWKFAALPAMPKGFEIRHGRRLFDQILVLKFLYPQNEKWDTVLVTPLQALIEEYSKDIELWHIGFPENWQEYLTSRNHTIDITT